MHKKNVIIATLGIGVIGLISGGTWWILRDNQAIAYREIAVEQGSIIKEIKVSGLVKPAQDVDLSWEKSGHVVSVATKVNDRVTVGQIIATLDSADLSTQLSQAKANADSARAQMDQLQAALDAANDKLTQLKNGSRPESISIQETQVAKAKQDLQNSYSNVAIVLSDVYTKAEDAVKNDTESFFYNASSNDPDLSFSINDSQLELSLVEKRKTVNADLSSMEKDLSTISSADNQTIEAKIVSTKKYLDDIKSYLNSCFDAVNLALSLNAATQSGYKTAINAARSEVNAAYSAINAQGQTIATQKIAVEAAQKQLDLLLAGAQNEDVQAQEAMVRQAQANIHAQEARIAQAQSQVDATNVQLSKNYLRSPIDGIISRQDVKVGQIVSPGVSLVGLMSDAQYEIETRLSETDVARVKVGDSANVNLDAYGDARTFVAKIISIDPVQSQANGMTGYKIRLQFTQNFSEIKAGMTANINILSDKKDNSLYVPQNVVIRKNDVYFTTMPDKTMRQVGTGLWGSDGRVEITSGLSAGDKVLSIGN